MVRTDSRSGKRPASDARRTAEEAARRAGVPLADWLDNVLDNEQPDAYLPEERIPERRLQRSVIDDTGRNRDWSTLRERSESLRRSVSHHDEPVRETVRETWRDERAVQRQRPARDEAPHRRQWREPEPEPGYDYASEPAPRRVSPAPEPAPRPLHGHAPEPMPRASRPVPEPVQPEPAPAPARSLRDDDRQAFTVIDDRIAQIERAFATRDVGAQETAQEPVTALLSQLDARIDTLAARTDRDRHADAAWQALGDRIGRLTDMIERLEETKANKERNAHAQRLEAKLNGILQSLEKPAPVRAAPKALALPPPRPQPAPQPAPRQAPEPLPAPSAKPSGGPARNALASIEEAVAGISRRQRELAAMAAARQPKAEPARAKPEPRPSPAPAPTPSIDLKGFDRRLEAIASRIERATDVANAPARAEPADLAALKVDINRLVARLDRAPVKETAAPVDFSVIEHLPVFDHLREQIARISARLEAEPRGRPKDGDRAFETLRDDIQKLTARIEEVRQPESDPGLALLRQEVGGLSQSLGKLASHQSVSTIEGALRDLSKRIEDVGRPESDPGLVLLRQEVGGLSQSLGKLASHQSVSGIERAMRDLSERIEGVQRPESDPGLELLRQEVGGLSRSLGKLASHQSVSGIENALRDLSLRIEESERPASDPGLALLRQDVGGLSQSLGKLASHQFASHQSVSGIENALRDLSQRIEESERPASDPGLALLRQEVGGLSQSLGKLASHQSVSSIENALRDLSQRIEESERPESDPDLALLRQEVGGLSRSLGKLASHQSVSGIENALRDLTQRIEENERPESDPGLALLRQDIGGLSQSLGKLASHQFASHQSVSGIENALRDLSQRIEESERPQSDSDLALLRQEVGGLSRSLGKLASHQSVSGIENALRDLSQRIEESGRPQSNPDLALLRQEVGGLSDSLAKLASRQSVSAIEGAVRDLSDRIEASRDDGIRESLLEPVEHLTAELRQTLRAADPRDTIEALDREIREIGKKLDGMANRGFDAHVFARISDQTQEIRDLLSAAAQRPTPFAMMEQHIAALNERLDELVAQAGAERAANPAATADDIRALLQGVLPVDALSGLEHRFQDLSDKLEVTLARPAVESDSIAALSRNIDRVQKTLSSQLAGVGDTRPLEAMIRRLAENVERIRKPDADLSMLEGLEAQIAQIATRLDRTDTHAATTESLQQIIGEMFGRLETARLSSLDAAEAAARAAAHETLREAIAHAESSPRVEAVSRELADLRAMQDEADQRTHSTLTAVHETLEKVVDRLASLERETVPVAGRAAAESDAPAPRTAAPAPVWRAQVSKAPGRAPLDLGAAQPAAADPAQFLIEPGSGFAPRRDESSALDKGQKAPSQRTPAGRAPDEQPTQSAFIAAARRAAQAAAAETNTAGESRVRTAAQADGVVTGDAPAVDRVRFFLKDRKRPLLLALAGIVILLGAYEVMRGLVPNARDTDADHAMADPAAAPIIQEPAKPRPPQALIAPADPHATAVPSPHAAAAGFDYTPVGSVGPTTATFARLAATPAMPPDGKARPAAAMSIPAMPDPARGFAATPLVETARAGDATAQFELATRLTDGRGMPRDLKQAGDWFAKAAAQGLVPAQYRLGIAYEKGLGVAEDLAAAKMWYQRAAEAGNAHAMHNLAVVLAAGTGGKADYAGAANWFRKAANFGIRDSQYNLAILYARGLGMEVDMSQSYVWFALAAAQGDDDAAHKRDLVAKRLSDQDLRAASAGVQAFRPAVLDRQANEVTQPAGGWTLTPPKLGVGQPKIS